MMKTVWNVKEIRGKKTMAEPGVFGYDAEAAVSGPDGKEVYVCVNSFDSERQYMVSRTSVYDYMAGDGDEPDMDFVEEYETFEDTKESAYRGVFELLDCIVTAMEEGVEEKGVF